MDNTELIQEFLDIYNSSRRFTDDEIYNFYDYFDIWGLIVDKVESERHRWQVPVSYICKIGDRYFSLDRYEALTELQEHSEWEQPYEVRPKEVTTIEWEEI